MLDLIPVDVVMLSGLSALHGCHASHVSIPYARDDTHLKPACLTSWYEVR